MKKRRLPFLLLIAAALLGIIATLSYLSKRNPSETGLTTLTFSHNILALEMKIGAADIRILSGEQFRIETDNPHITAEENRGILVIREKSHIDDLENSTLTLYIPRGFLLEDAEIIAGAGKLEIEGLICRELDLNLGAGMAEIHSLTAERSADIEGGAGKILIHDSKLHNLDFEMGVGEAEIFSLLTGDAEISAGVGQLALTIPAHREDYTIRAKSGIGSIEIAGDGIIGQKTLGSGPDRIELESGIGNIHVYFEPQ